MRKLTPFILAAAAMFSACDEGEIQPSSYTYTSNMTVTLTAHLKGYSVWENTTAQALSLAIFGDNDYAKISKNIQPDANGDVNMTMSGSSLSDVNTLEVCLLGSLRDRIVTFESKSISDADQSIEMNLGDIDVSPLAAVQKAVFIPTCAQCHGGSSTAAQGLYLTGDTTNAVNKASNRVEGSLIVKPGDHSNSVIYQLFTSDISADWHVNHRTFIQDENYIKAIELWIDNLDE